MMCKTLFVLRVNCAAGDMIGSDWMGQSLFSLTIVPIPLLSKIVSFVIFPCILALLSFSRNISFHKRKMPCTVSQLTH